VQEQKHSTICEHEKGAKMPQQNSSSGAKWWFLLAIVVMAAIFMLGFNVKDAKWLNGEIAAAEARQMNSATDTKERAANLDYLKSKAQIEIDTAKQLQVIGTQAVLNIQVAKFLGNVGDTLNAGLMLLVVAVTVVVTAFGLYGSFGLHRLVVAQAQAIAMSQPIIASHQQTRRQRSPGVIEARKRELRQRGAKVAMKSTKPFWTDEEFVPGKYPWAN